jgi:hypothetical protein
MTAKEKAEELVARFIQANGNSFFAKECALIAVDEILNSFNNVFDDFVVESSKTGGYRNMKNYWREVEREILNMKVGDK